MNALTEAQAILRLLDGLQTIDDGEAGKSAELVRMLLTNTVEPFSRGQFTPGHITCTGLVVHPEGGRVLLVHHQRLDRWLMPGGHVEPGDARVEDAARREVVEETAACLPAGEPPLVSVDVHGIPGGRGEPYHLHHDLIFGFRAETGDFRISAESRDARWWRFNELSDARVAEKIRRAHRRFTAGPAAGSAARAET